MATAKKAKKIIIKVKDNPKYCGIGACGIQFANGQAEVDEGTNVNWFKEHEGYEVIDSEAE